jgi:hypothetical protein
MRPILALLAVGWVLGAMSDRTHAQQPDQPASPQADPAAPTEGEADDEAVEPPRGEATDPTSTGSPEVAREPIAGESDAKHPPHDTYQDTLPVSTVRTG